MDVRGDADGDVRYAILTSTDNRIVFTRLCAETCMLVDFGRNLANNMRLL